MKTKLLGTLAAFSLATVLALGGQGTEKAAGKAAGKATAGKGVEGSWVATAVNIAGKKIPAEQVEKARLTATFKDGNFSAEFAGQPFAAGTYKLSGKDKIEMTHTEGKQKGKTEKGLYKLEGDTLVTAFPAGDSTAEPKSFEPGEMTEISTFKREGAAAPKTGKKDAKVDGDKK